MAGRRQWPGAVCNRRRSGRQSRNGQREGKSRRCAWAFAAKCLNHCVTTPDLVDFSHRSPSGHSHCSRSSNILLIARGKQYQKSREAMAKGKSQSVADYFDCLMMLGPSSLGLLAASCGACFDGDDDAARLPRESALSRVQRGRSSGGRVEAHREDLPLPAPGRLANAALRVKSLGCCFARADAPKGSKGSKELDSL